MGETRGILDTADEIIRVEAEKILEEERARVWAVGDSPVGELFDGTGMLYASDEEPSYPTVRELLADRARYVAGRFLARVLRSR